MNSMVKKRANAMTLRGLKSLRESGYANIDVMIRLMIVPMTVTTIVNP